ncbi:MAG: transcription elongation factor GreB [Gammaproteobacteria bacterium]|nr:transcription elongation factor GreB [Gammaproteobacteria bacterium]
MGRYRPPQPPSSKYITPGGREKLQQELDYLWHKKRPIVTRAVSAAAAEGDRSENAEYIYRKKQLREIDSRIRFLRKRLEDMVVVDNVPDDQRRVYFGAWVTLESEDGLESCYRIVGPDEIDPEKSLISMDSPLAKALMGKSIDTEIEVETPNGKRAYFIVNVVYENKKVCEG